MGSSKEVTLVSSHPVYDDDDSDPDKPTCCQKCCHHWKSNLLSALLFLGVLVGIGLGVFLRLIPPFDRPKLAPREMMYLFLPGELLMRALMFIAIPLVVSNLISGFGSMNSRVSGRVGLRTFVYYLSTTMIAVMEGFVFVYAVKPGTHGYTTVNNDTHTDAINITLPENKVDMALDFFRNLIPDNLATTCFQMSKSKVNMIPVVVQNNTVMVEKFHTESQDGVNMIGLTFFCIIFGLATARLGNKGRPFLVFFDALFEAVMIIVHGFLWLYPLALISMMAYTVILIEDPVTFLMQSFVFIVTVVGGLVCHALIVLPILYAAITRRNPLKLLVGCGRALLTAFTTADGTMTLPVTIDCLRKLGLDPRIIRSMCPIGATINMDGFALYEGMACVFVATIRGITLGPAQIVALGFTAVAVSIGTPSMGDFVLTHLILFNVVGLPPEDVFLLVPYNWILTRFRTFTNVWGDCIGVGIVDTLSKKELANMAAAEPDDDVSSVDIDDGPTDGAVLTGYNSRNPKDWTVHMINESGDRLVVSKV